MSSVASLVKVKGKKAVVESARNTGDEWATLQSGRGAGWQLHTRVRCTSQAPWRLWGFGSKLRKAYWGGVLQGSWTHEEVRPIVCKAAFWRQNLSPSASYLA